MIEQIFAIPGLGRHFVTSIGNRDYSVVLGTTLLYGVAIVFANMMVDITYASLIHASGWNKIAAYSLTD